MPLKAPNLDDRTFEQLLAEAQAIVRRKGIGWTDLSPSDPGSVLLELFAHLTEVMIFRLNRMPEKAYVEFLRLLGVRLHPSSAATVELQFSRKQASSDALTIPRSTRVQAGRAERGQEPVIFMTTEAATIAPDETDVTVTAFHAEQVDGELAGRGSGMAGQSVRVQRPPIIAPTGDALDLVVAIEATEDELDERIPALQHDDKVYRVWREVQHFTNLGDDAHVYVVDRNSGIVIFAPAVQMQQRDGALDESPQLLAAVPAANREIRVWYRRGGGAAGNVAEGQLTTLKDALPGVTVSNPKRATGGKSAETLQNALLRGPQELHSLQRAVTAKDFELIAKTYSSRAVVRAKAFTRAALWQHAAPGHVEILLVPDVPESERAQVSLELLDAHRNDTVLAQIAQALDERRPLGTTCVVNWARYKQVKVKAQIVVQREEDLDALSDRIRQRLNQTITPVPTDFNSTGWAFGQALRASNVYDIALAEPGVRWVDSVRLLVEEVPDQEIGAIAIDHFQPHTWYVGSGNVLFRSLNNGDGWEPAGRFTGKIVAIEAHPNQAGLLAVATMEEKGSQVLISADCGESWTAGQYAPAFTINDLAWMMRDNLPVLLLATEAGLYEITVGRSPVQVLVNAQDQDMGFYAVIAHTDVRGISSVAVAAQSLGGVYLSNTGGRPNTFRRVTANLPDDSDVRVLAVQYDGPRAFLWAGTAATGGGVGKGCFRWELRGKEDPPEGWVAYSAGWEAGSCKGLAFHRSQVFAASHRLGVVKLDASRPNAQWLAPAITCGLPLREREQQRLFHPVDAVAASLDSAEPLLMAGGVQGVYRSQDEGLSYNASSSKEFIEKVTLPDTWLFVSDTHEIEVISEDDTQ